MADLDELNRASPVKIVGVNDSGIGTGLVKFKDGGLLSIPGQDYMLEREVVGLGESKRTESMWIKTSIKDPDSGELLATVLLNSATLKQSYEKYDEEAQRIGKQTG